MYVCMTNIYKRKLVYIATWQKYMIVTIHKIIFLITSPQRKVTQLPTVAVLERRSSLFRRPPGYHHLPCGYHHLTGRYQKVQPHTVQVHPQKLLQTSPPQYGMAAKNIFKDFVLNSRPHPPQGFHEISIWCCNKTAFMCTIYMACYNTPYKLYT